MFRKLTICIILVALGLAAGSALAAFENVPVSPRARGMGETGVAVPDGVYATALNPSHLGSWTTGGLAASYVRPFGVNYADFVHLGAAVPLSPKDGAIGISLSKYTVDYTGVRLADETQLTFGYGRSLYKDLHSSVDIGASVNMYHLKFGESISGIKPGNDTALGLDLGMLLTLHRRTHVAFMIKNMNNPQIGIDEEELGQRLTGAVSYIPYDGVVTTFEIDNELGQDVQYHGGLEMVMVEGFALRAGVITNPSKLTAGFGYQAQGFSVDYGFSTGGGTLTSTHQFGVRFAWGGEAQ